MDNPTGDNPTGGFFFARGKGRFRLEKGDLHLGKEEFTAAKEEFTAGKGSKKRKAPAGTGRKAGC
jgi:predicted NUDIX family NTP pyrophosphohydrolase